VPDRGVFEHFFPPCYKSPTVTYMQLLTSDVAINTRVTSLRVDRGINVGRNRMTYCCSIGSNMEVFGGVRKRAMFVPVAALRSDTFIFLSVCTREKSSRNTGQIYAKFGIAVFLPTRVCILQRRLDHITDTTWKTLTQLCMHLERQMIVTKVVGRN
jgi:hypothetical protein